ncbi:oxygenase MpaB family protein [Nocardia carnea]|uniref:Oxygenase MpaB family protein n=1 Tax=Nocardia carnea TaxID=37328 RepID=A0ABW7TM89_9NOCA|nr:oxygenase MpaB family protein [Nocardia carnea]
MTRIVPTRHPDTPRGVPGLRPFALALGIRRSDTARWRDLGESLLVADPAMDELVAWMCEAGTATTRPLFERALTTGIDSVPDAPEPLVAFFRSVETPPEWVDPELLRRGAQVYRMGGADGLYLARDVSFLGGYLASGFNRTLLRTGALEKGPAARFAETLRWAMDVSGQDAMARFGPGYRSTLRVRLIHSLVRRHLLDRPDWRTEDWGLPINQTDMAATLVGALLAPFVGGIAMGMLPRRADLDAAAHLTRYVGWLIGVEDRWLPTGFRDGVRILFHCLTAIMNPDETSRRLAIPLARDPLGWSYPNMARLRGQFARAQHLSLATAFLGPRSVHRLGLWPFMPPWYPLLRLPVNLLRSAAARFAPGGRARAATRGRRQQQRFLELLTGPAATHQL